MIGVSFIREWSLEDGVVFLRLFFLEVFSMMMFLFARVSGGDVFEIDVEPIVGDEVLIVVVVVVEVDVEV